MAESKVIGNDFFLRIDTGSAEAYIVCEQNSELSLSAEVITVLCKTTGQWAEILAGGTKSGSISFTGVYVKDPTVPNISAFELAALVGTVQDVIWGGIASGDEIVEAPAHISDVSIASNTNEAITFTATLTLAGEPTITTYTT